MRCRSGRVRGPRFGNSALDIEATQSQFRRAATVDHHMTGAYGIDLQARNGVVELGRYCGEGLSKAFLAGCIFEI